MNYGPAFESCLHFTLDNEAKRIYRPGTRPTKHGISKIDIACWKHVPVTQVSDEALQSLTFSEAAEIYYILYWKPLNLERVHSSLLCKLIFDVGVSQGLGTAVLGIQRILGEAEDGNLGPGIISLLNRSNPTRLAIAFVKQTAMRYAWLVNLDATQCAHMQEWTVRVNSLWDLIIEDMSAVAQ